MPIRNSNTGGGSRTHTGVSAQRILSPQRLPFRHAGSCGEVSTGRRCHKRKEPSRPGRFAIGAGPIRSRSDRSGGTPIHDQHGPHHRYRGIPLLRPIYLASQRPATDPLGQFAPGDRRQVRGLNGAGEHIAQQAGWLGRSGLFLWSWRRRGWDSNPRTGGTCQRFSRPSRSTTLAPLRKLRQKTDDKWQITNDRWQIANGSAGSAARQERGSFTGRPRR